MFLINKEVNYVTLLIAITSVQDSFGYSPLILIHTVFSKSRFDSSDGNTLFI